MEKPEIEVISYEELENGGAEIIIEVNPPMRDFLIGEGIKSILLNQINSMEGLDDEKDTCCGACSSDDRD